MKRSILLSLTALGCVLSTGCGTDGIGGARLIVPSAVTLDRNTVGNRIAAEIEVDPRGFAFPTQLFFVEQSEDALTGIGIGLPNSNPCNVVGETPPDCSDYVADLQSDDTLIFPVFEVVGSAPDTERTMRVVLVTFGTTTILDEATFTLRLKNERGTYTASGPGGNVQVERSAGTRVEIPITVTPDANFVEPVRALVDETSLPTGVAIVEERCRVSDGAPPACRDTIADVPNTDMEARLVLEVTEPLPALGPHMITVDLETLALPRLTDGVSVALEVVTPTP